MANSCRPLSNSLGLYLILREIRIEISLTNILSLFADKNNVVPFPDILHSVFNESNIPLYYEIFSFAFPFPLNSVKLGLNEAKIKMKNLKIKKIKLQWEREEREIHHLNTFHLFHISIWNFPPNQLTTHTVRLSISPKRSAHLIAFPFMNCFTIIT